MPPDFSPGTAPDPVFADPPAPSEGWTVEKIVVGNLPAGRKWYFAAKAIDNAGQKSLLSNVATNVSTGSENQVMDLDGDGYGIGCPLGNDPDDYDPSVTGK